jgi:uncharacterized protein (TIGR00369 family)
MVPAMTAGGFNDALGLRFDEVTADRVVLGIDIGPQHHQPHGIVHGGVWSSMVETAASVGAAAWYGERGRVVGVANQTDFLRAVDAGPATATATPIHQGRLQQLWVVEIRDGGDRLLARGQVRLQNLPSSG